MPALAYRDVLEQWDRSRAFGDPRDLTSFSNDLNTRTGTQDYSAGLRDGWWTRASTRADQYLFDPVANATTKPLGEAIGGLFGQPEAGGRVGTALPRALLETAPLYLLGPEAGIPATTAALGGTGALMAAHTYADTGSAKAAAISGITGAALPAIGRIGGNAFLKAFGVADRVAGELPALTEDAAPRVFNDLYPKEGVSPTTFKLTRLAGSQTAMIAANQASMYATDKTLGQPYDPLSPDFWANQIPFTVFDLVHAAHGEVPTAEQMRTTRNAPVTEPESTYVPPPSDPVEQAQVEATLARFEVISQDPQATPEQKAGALSAALQTIADPKGVVQEKVAPKEQEVTLTGHGRLTEQGNFKMLVDPERSDKGLNIPAHGNVWINQNPQMQVTQNPDNTFTVKSPARFVNGNIEKPLKAEDFAPKLNPAQNPNLPAQPEPWKGFGPDQQRTLEQHGVPAPTPEMPEDVKQHLRETVDKLEQAQVAQKETKAKIEKVPQDATEIPELFQSVEFAPAQPLEGGLHSVHLEQKNPLNLEAAAREPDGKVINAKGSLFHGSLEGTSDNAELGFVDSTGKFYTREEARVATNEANAKKYITVALKDGATPTQAVETARLVAQTPQLDASLELENLAKDILRKEKNRAKYDKGKPQNVYGEAVKGEDGKRLNFASRADALEYQDAHPELAEHTIRDNGRGKYYLAPVLNKEVSLDAPVAGDATLHGVVPDNSPLDLEQQADESVATNLDTNVNTEPDVVEIPVDSRPSVSIQDVISTLERASREPKVMDELLDNQGDLAQTLTEISTTRKYLQAVANGENPTADAALARTVAKVTKATGMYTRKFRNWTMNSEMPFDEELVNQTKIRKNPHAALITFADNKESGVMGQFARDLANALPGLADVKVTFNPREGWNYDPNNQTINVGWLPSHENHMVAFGMDLAHEVAHHATRDLMTRQDAAAVQFRGSLTKILEFTRKSPMLPDKVKATIKTAIAEDWYSDHIDAGETKNVLNNVKEGTSLFQRFQDVAGVENKQWYGAFYGLLNHEELVSTMFNDPDMVALLRATKMPQGFVKNALDFFTNAWAKVFGGKPETQSALGMLLTHFDNYLGGEDTQNYNGRDFIRDSLLFSGVRDSALTSRIDTVEKTFNTGNLADSIEGFRREAENKTLPATVESGSISRTIQDALIGGKPDDVTQGTLSLLMDEVPVHQELWRRMKQDLDLATRLYTSVKNGEVPGSVPENLAENIKLSQVRLNAMAKALVKQQLSIARLNDLNNFTPDGMQNTIVGQLMGRKLPGPNIDPTGLEPEAHEILALTRRTTSRAELEKGKLQKTGEWLMRTFAMTQFMKQQIPEFRSVADNVQHEQGEAFVRANRANFVYGADPDTQELDKKQIATNIRVEQNASLSRAASDIRRWVQTQERAGESWSLDDPFVKEVLGRSGDPKAVISEFEASQRRREDDSQMVTPQNLSKLNWLVTARRIVASEPGMKPDVGRDLSAEMYDAIAKMKDPATQQDGVMALRDLSTKMQANTFSKTFDLTNKLIQVAQNHIDLRAKTPGYVTEQRFDAEHVVMVTPDGKPYRASFKTPALAKADIEAKEAKGYTFLDHVPKSDANVSGGVNDDVIKSMQELDTQVANALMESTKDDPNLYARFLPYTQRASDYAASAAAYDFVPGAASPRRKFIAGREGINMVTNENLYYIKQNNWWRHKLIRAQSDLDMLDPDLAGNRTALQYSQQHVENQLSADNPLTRKIVEATYNWKLAWNFGVNFLHGIQSLTTGMASAIAETGSVGDAFGLTTKAQKAVIQRMTTGKWDTEDHKWLAQKLTATGNAGIASWTDIYGEDLATMYNANRATTVPGKGIEFIKNASRGWTGMFLKFNDQIGAIAGFDLARSRGMSHDDAFQFALDLKNRGYYTGGKQQRAVGLWSIKSKPVPQLMSSLQTYTFGWFSQLANNAINGFGTLPKGLTETQRLGAKKAFFYQLGAQAVLAGAIGLPGVGQGMALLKQTTGTDYKAWLRQHMADLFDEDQENGGIMTSLALHGLVATATPMDPSGRHIPTFPFIGVSPYKGFDVANLATAPVSSAADVVKGLMAAAKGDVEGASGLLPHVLQGPFNLWQGEGDVRDKHGNLVYQMSPSERFVTALGMTPSKVANAKDIAEAAKQASQAATQEKSRIIANLATTYRKQGSDVGRQAVTEYLQQHPDEKGPQFVAAIGRAVRDQTQPQDWRRTANPNGDYTGLSADYGVPVGETMGRNLQRGVEQSLGLNRRPDPRGDLQAQQIDEITASNPYLSRGEALRQVQQISLNRHRSALLLNPALQSPYQ